MLLTVAELPVDLLENFACLRSFDETQCWDAQQKLFAEILSADLSTLL